MSLDVYLEVEQPVATPRGSGIFIRESGEARTVPKGVIMTKDESGGAELKPRELMKAFLENAKPKELEEWVDGGFRHKTGAEATDFLRHWLGVARHFGYATRDDSWGEFEKEFCIIITRLVVAERDLDRLRATPVMARRVDVERCDWCGAEEPTAADALICRETPCRLLKKPLRTEPTK